MISSSSPPAAPSASRSVDRLALALAFVASIAVLAAIWIVDYIPTHDGPHHILLSYLRNHLADAGRGFTHFLAPGAPITNLGFTTLFHAFESMVSWKNALRLTLSVSTLAWAWGLFALVTGLDPRRAMLGLIGFASAFQWALYMGFFSFYIATAAGMLTLAFALRVTQWTNKTRVYLGALLFVQAVFHVFAAEVTGVILVALALCRARNGRERVRELAVLALVALPTLVVALLTTRAGPAMLARADLRYAHTIWPPWPERLALFARCFTSGPAWRAWPPALLALAGLVDFARRARSRDVTREEMALTSTSAFMAVLAIAVPLSTPAWQYVSPRFAAMAVVLAIPLLAIERWNAPRPRVVAALALVGFALASMAWAGHHHRSMARSAADALAGLEQPLRRSGPRLPIVIDTLGPPVGDPWAAEVPHAAPLLNIGSLYAMAQGGMMAYSFTGSAELHEFLMRPEAHAAFPAVPDRAYAAALADPSTPDYGRAAVVATLASIGVSYEDIVVRGRPRDLRAFVSRGYQPDWQRGNMLIAHFVGCPVQIAIRSPRALTSGARVEYGWLPLRHAFWSSTVPATDHTVALPHAPCGPIWFMVEAAGVRCAGANSEGRVFAEVTAGRVLECVLGTHSAD